MAAPVAQHPLEQYEALEIIGNGSFGIIRKVRRKSDGVTLARKELNFERMTERDRKQIVAEVNILKDLCHENIVRYHDRYVDRDNGILYILMEYCGGGDLGTIIKNCTRANRPLPEDTIWAYFLQILLALQHCHFPSTEGSSSSSGTATRQQILHRDLKPENVFLDANQVIKLGDFGLSKALGAANFANTYVGTPYYMSPELMQERSYDTKSDIWSLGCLIYELCALKPPFHEAKTHNELSIFIRNGRIPPLPRGYSQALHQIIKSMLNINPAMRPSAQQLLQHDRLELVYKVHETEKMLVMAKAHKQTLVNRERDVLLRERELQAREASLHQRIADMVARREAELEAGVAEAVALRVSEAVAQRESELREAVMRKEEEVRERIEKREAELLQAVVRREEELRLLWERYEAGLREELSTREEQVRKAEEEVKIERERVEDMMRTEGSSHSGPVAFPTTRLDHSPEETPTRIQNNSLHARLPRETPYAKFATPGSAMRGIILTDTGETIATPNPVELARLVLDSPRVGLNFDGIFEARASRVRDYDEDSEDGDGAGEESESEPASPSTKRRLVLERREKEREKVKVKRREEGKENISPQPPSAPPTRLRKPSIRTSLQRPALPASVASCPTSLPTHHHTSQPLAPASHSMPTPMYDPEDEDNLPSPFLKRTDRGKTQQARRGSAAHDLRAKAAANAAMGSGKKDGLSVGRSARPTAGGANVVARPSLERAKQASEDAKKALFKP